MNAKKRKVEIQDNSSDEFPIREPGKTWAIKPAKSYWQEVPVTLEVNLFTFRRINKELILIQMQHILGLTLIQELLQCH